jgi:hypothetical protein
MDLSDPVINHILKPNVVYMWFTQQADVQKNDCWITSRCHNAASRIISLYSSGTKESTLYILWCRRSLRLGLALGHTGSGE